MSFNKQRVCSMERRHKICRADIIKKKNSEITSFCNAEYISVFYFIPKSILDKCGEEINSIPRNPRKLLQDCHAIEIIEIVFLYINPTGYNA